MPDTMTEADVITIFKKGNVEDPQNYRPISLLNSIYKIYAALIKNRLVEVMEPYISATQFGYRKARSTSQPLYITRRLQDYAEAYEEKLLMIFLDWEKAFDKVYQDELINAIRRMNIPEKCWRLLSHFITTRDSE